jgi:hypothetical protein
VLRGGAIRQAISRFNQSFNGSTKAGDFFGAPGAVGAADADPGAAG